MEDGNFEGSFDNDSCSSFMLGNWCIFGIAFGKKNKGKADKNTQAEIIIYPNHQAPIHSSLLSLETEISSKIKRNKKQLVVGLCGKELNGKEPLYFDEFLA